MDEKTRPSKETIVKEINSSVVKLNKHIQRLMYNIQIEDITHLEPEILESIQKDITQATAYCVFAWDELFKVIYKE